MSHRKSVANWLCMLAVGAVVTMAEPPNAPIRKTAFSINEPLEVPGMILEPDLYVIKLVEPEAHRNVLEVFETVQLWSADETRLLSTMLTMPNYDLPTTDKTVFSFFDRGPKQPKALRLWFAPGRNYGQEFVYPKAQAVELAKVVGRGVLAMPPELPGDIGRLARMVVEPTSRANKPPLLSASPDPRVNPPTPPQPPASPLSEPTQKADARPARDRMASPTPPAPQNAAQPAVSNAASRARLSQDTIPLRSPKLPKTAGFLPVLASLGLLAMAAGALLHVLARRLERT